MFQKQEHVEVKKEIETVIGPSVRVEGNFRGDGNVIVEGVVNGSLKTNQNLKVGKDARISANVWAANANISGEVRGNIKIKDNLDLTSTARIYGDIETKILIVAPGAILHGKCAMVKEVPETPEEKEKKEKTKQKKDPKESVKKMLPKI